MEKTRGPIFSVNFDNPEFPGEIWAADWDSIAKKWGMSHKEVGSPRWDFEPGISEIASNAISKKFGLGLDDLGINSDRLERLSPAELIKFRRIIEEGDCLPKLKVATDNFDVILGRGNVPHYAEEYS